MATTVIQDAAAVATAAGGAFVGWQLVLARRQLTAQFEQTFVDRYERIIARVPLALLLGESHEISAQAHRAFYDYFELCEEELYYRSTRRVSARTWHDWWEGVALHLQRPAFEQAWDALKDRTVIQTSSASRIRVEQFNLLRTAMSAIDEGRPFDPFVRRWRRT